MVSSFEYSHWGGNKNTNGALTYCRPPNGNTSSELTAFELLASGNPPQTLGAGTRYSADSMVVNPAIDNRESGVVDAALLSQLNY